MVASLSHMFKEAYECADLKYRTHSYYFVALIKKVIRFKNEIKKKLPWTAPTFFYHGQYQENGNSYSTSIESQN